MGSVGRRLRRNLPVLLPPGVPPAAPSDLAQSEQLLAALRGLPVPEGGPTLFTVTSDEGGSLTLAATNFVATMLDGVDKEIRYEAAPEPGSEMRVRLDFEAERQRIVHASREELAARYGVALLSTDDSYEVRGPMAAAARAFAEREALAWLREPNAEAYEQIETRTYEGGMYRADEDGRLSKVEEEEP